MEATTVPLLTQGFTSEDSLKRHFQKHGREFGAKTAQEYEAFADRFIGSPLSSGVLQCPRNGETVRYNPDTKEFGVLDSSNKIVTYMRLSHPTDKLRRNYFRRQCRP